MKTVLKWVVRVLGGIVGLLVIAIAVIYGITESRVNTTYDIPDEEITIPTDAESIANGKRLTSVRGCVDCHGKDLSGTVMADDPVLGKLIAANLTPGEGGAGQTYTDADWVRAIRHGVAPDGKGLIAMPSVEFNGLNADDMGDIIAYLKSLDPVDRVEEAPQLGPLARVLMVFQLAPIFSADMIDHAKPMPEVVEVGETVEYGEYQTETCKGCHKADFSGGPLPGDDSGIPAANLTPAGDMAGWTEADFIKAMREGIRPDGSQISDKMPWKILGPAYTDVELKAIWKFLQELPPVESKE